MSSTAELYKNREADMGNPNLHNFNIYHTIDEEKVSKSVEHLYDEIKHKNKDYGKIRLLVSIDFLVAHFLRRLCHSKLTCFLFLL